MDKILHYSYETIKYSPYTSIVEQPNKMVHFNDFWKFTYAISGQATNIVEGVTRELTNTTIMFIKPYDKIQTTEYTENYRHRDIYVSDERMREICSFLPDNPYEKLIEKTPYFKANIVHMENLEHLLNIFPPNSEVKNDYLLTLHTCVIVNLLTLFIESEKAEKKIPKWLTELHENASMEKNMQGTVEELIADIPYSHGHICREFKKYFGLTLAEYLTRCKIIYSSQLLMQKQYSIADIAYSLNFSTQSSFIKSFKAFYGCSPGRWRNKNLQDKESTVTVKWGHSQNNN